MQYTCVQSTTSLCYVVHLCRVYYLFVLCSTPVQRLLPVCGVQYTCVQSASCQWYVVHLCRVYYLFVVCSTPLQSLLPVCGVQYTCVEQYSRVQSTTCLWCVVSMCTVSYLICVQYNWKASVTNLNYWPQFMTSISGMDLHFIHVKPTNAGTPSLSGCMCYIYSNLLPKIYIFTN